MQDTHVLLHQPRQTMESSWRSLWYNGVVKLKQGWASEIQCMESVMVQHTSTS